VIDKLMPTLEDAVAGIGDGATVMIGGFGGAGQPTALIEGLVAQGARELTIVNNNAGNGTTGLAALLAAGRVRKVVCSFPRQADSQVFDALYRAHRDHLRSRYDLVVTEVSVRNTRSLRAHERVGFRELQRYRDSTDHWVIVSWDWT